MLSRQLDRDDRQLMQFARSFGTTVDAIAGRDVICPAGENHSVGCICRIEQKDITIQADPYTFMARCTGDYVRCPTWQAGR